MHRLERSAPQSVGARVQERRTFLASGGTEIDAKPCQLRGERFPAFSEERRDLLGRRYVRIVFEIDQRQPRQRARDFAPLPKTSDTVAHH